MSDNVPTVEERDKDVMNFFQRISEQRNQSATVPPPAPRIETSILTSDQIKGIIKTPPKDLVKTIKV